MIYHPQGTYIKGVSAKTAPPQNFENLYIKNVKSWEAETSPICLSDQIDRLVKFQLPTSTCFRFRAFQSFRRPCFCGPTL